MKARPAADGDRSFVANDRRYVLPGEPVVVVCIDGSGPAYHEQAVAAGAMPWLAEVLATGTSWPAQCALPALTNVNNTSIATGLPPSGHGISGNHMLDATTGAEVQLTDPVFLRAPTLFARAHAAGFAVAVVTAKDKLSRLLGAGLPEDRCWSAERSAQPRPEVYSAHLSLAALAEGVRVLDEQSPDLLYISLSDYIQHKHAPGTGEANSFYAGIDRACAELSRDGAVVLLTADHGMSAKPCLVFLDDLLADRLSSAAARIRTVLPITDPYVAHHGALGSFAMLHLDSDADRPATDAAHVLRAAAQALHGVPGIAEVLVAAEAAARWSLPADRIGDLVVLADADTALGRSMRHHDLSGLDRPLRSHGGPGELQVPFIVNRDLGPIPPAALAKGTGSVHNYDAFWAATTLVGEAAPTTCAGRAR